MTQKASLKNKSCYFLLVMFKVFNAVRVHNSLYVRLLTERSGKIPVREESYCKIFFHLRL